MSRHVHDWQLVGLTHPVGLASLGSDRTNLLWECTERVLPACVVSTTITGHWTWSDLDRGQLRTAIPGELVELYGDPALRA